MEKRELFDIVRHGRERVKDWHPERLGASTTAQYDKIGVRYRDRIAAGETVAAILGTDCAWSTWYHRRAVLNHLICKRITELLSICNDAQKAGDWTRATVAASRIGQWLDIIIPKCPVSYQPSKLSKRATLGRVPKDWRERFWSEVPAGHKYRPALAAMMLAGVRPQELVNGITAVPHPDNPDLALIKVIGAKVTETHGQPSRTVTVHRSSEPAQALLAVGEFRVPSAHAITVWVARVSAKLWPRVKSRPSPYSFRHAASADAKAAGVSRAGVAKFLGQASERTQQNYGKAGQSSGAFAPVAVEACRDVRPAPDPIGVRQDNSMEAAADAGLEPDNTPEAFFGWPTSP